MNVFAATHQLCNLFFNYFFEFDVVHLVMFAELRCNCGFTHGWRSGEVDSNWLKMDKPDVHEYMSDDQLDQLPNNLYAPISQ